MKRISVIATVLILCLSVSLFSCADAGNSDTAPDAAVTDESAQGTVNAESKWDGVDFNDEQIIVCVSNAIRSEMTSAGAGNAVKYIVGPDSYTTDSVQNAVYDRNSKVTDTLGLKVKYIYNSSDHFQMSYELESYVLADLDSSPDLAIVPTLAIFRAGIQGILCNAVRTDVENYFDLSDEYGWYSELMYENTFDESTVYMLAGDYFIDLLRFSHNVIVDIDMYNELFASEGGINTLYDVIEDGLWSYDELMRCAERAYIDQGTRGLVDEEDVFGIITHPYYLGRDFFTSTALDVFEEKDGKLQYIEDVTDIHNYVDTLIRMASSDTFHFFTPANGKASTDYIVKGKALFTLHQPVYVLEGSVIRSLDRSVGIIPFPMHESSTDYTTPVKDVSSGGAILINTDKFTEVSAFTQMMSEETAGGAGTVMYEYFDVALKYKFSADARQMKMLEIIKDGLCSPKHQLFDYYFTTNIGMKNFDGLIYRSVAAKENTFASDWTSQRDAIQKSLEDT